MLLNFMLIGRADQVEEVKDYLKKFIKDYILFDASNTPIKVMQQPDDKQVIMFTLPEPLKQINGKPLNLSLELLSEKMNGALARGLYPDMDCQFFSLGGLENLLDNPLFTARAAARKTARGPEAHAHLRNRVSNMLSGSILQQRRQRVEGLCQKYLEGVPTLSVQGGVDQVADSMRIERLLIKRVLRAAVVSEGAQSDVKILCQLGAELVSGKASFLSQALAAGQAKNASVLILQGHEIKEPEVLLLAQLLPADFAIVEPAFKELAVFANIKKHRGAETAKPSPKKESSTAGSSKPRLNLRTSVQNHVQALEMLSMKYYGLSFKEAVETHEGTDGNPTVKVRALMTKIALIAAMTKGGDKDLEIIKGLGGHAPAVIPAYAWSSAQETAQSHSSSVLNSGMPGSGHDSDSDSSESLGMD
jgi:hypothetical protein